MSSSSQAPRIDDPPALYEHQLTELILAALHRLETEMQATAPFMAEQTSTWLRGLSGPRRPEEYFTHPHAFPVILAPWLLERRLTPSPDVSFQSDLVYSTINGHYFIRLLDDVFDSRGKDGSRILPAASFFYLHFHEFYRTCFPGEHPFWDLFAGEWIGSWDLVMQDASVTDLDLPGFCAVTARKSRPALIPVAAVCYRYERPELIDPWRRFFELLGRWHQMADDIFDCMVDLENDNTTYLISEARRRRRAGEPLEAWILQEGIDWGVELLLEWMGELEPVAQSLQCPAIELYLQQRKDLLLTKNLESRKGRWEMARLINALNAASA